jgi:hypothetical protein
MCWVVRVGDFERAVHGVGAVADADGERQIVGVEVEMAVRVDEHKRQRETAKGERKTS